MSFSEIGKGFQHPNPERFTFEEAVGHKKLLNVKDGNQVIKQVAAYKTRFHQGGMVRVRLLIQGAIFTLDKPIMMISRV